MSLLPPVQITQTQQKPKRPRPISPQDNAATTGLVVNPNGTYVSSPTNAVYGQFGSPYSMLPQVNLGTQPQTPNQQIGNTVQTALNKLLPQKYLNPANFGVQQPGNTGVQQYTTPQGPPKPPTQPGQPAAPFLTSSMLNGSPQAQAFGIGNNQSQIADQMLMRIAQGDDPSQLSAAERAALENMITGQTAQQQVDPNKPFGGFTNKGTGKFEDTASQQYYTSQGTDFYNQDRWDPSANGGKGGYVKIGKLIRQGKLNEKTGKFTPWKNKGGGGGNNYVAPVKTPQQPIPSFGVVSMSLNTATG